MGDSIYLKIPKKSASGIINLYNEKRVCLGDCPDKQIDCTSCSRNLIEFKIDSPRIDPELKKIYEEFKLLWCLSVSMDPKGSGKSTTHKLWAAIKKHVEGRQ